MKPKIHWCTPITGGDKLKLVEYSDYEKLQAENERLKQDLEYHVNNRMQLTSQIAELFCRIEQLTQTNKP